MFIYRLILFMCYGEHADMPSRYSKEKFISALASSFKIMPFPEQPTFMADGGCGYKGPAILFQYGTTVMSSGVNQSSGRTCIAAQILPLPILLPSPPFHRCSAPKHCLQTSCILNSISESEFWRT